jgi:rRNA maturation RNase YbeY
MILIAGEHQKLKGLKKLCKEVVKQIVLDHSKSLDELNIILVDDEALLDMNITYLQHDYYTDIITHDFCEGNKVNGELYISYERIKENAKTYGVSFHVELFRIIIHGTLHLCGYKDKTKIEKNKMTEMENHYLNTFNIEFHVEQNNGK